VKLSEAVAIELRRAIARGEYRPGERLTEAALCERFKVSRTPVREALRELEAEGLVTITSNLGASVVKLTLEDMNHIYDMLIVLEGTACSMASTRMSDRLRAEPSFSPYNHRGLGQPPPDSDAEADEPVDRPLWPLDLNAHGSRPDEGHLGGASRGD